MADQSRFIADSDTKIFAVKSKDPVTGTPLTLSGSLFAALGASLSLEADFGDGAWHVIQVMTANTVQAITQRAAQRYRVNGTGAWNICAEQQLVWE